MSFKQEIFMLLYLFILDAPEPKDWCIQLRDDVFWLFKNSCSFNNFKYELIAKALPHSSKRIRFYNKFLKFIDNYLKLN